MRADFSRLAPRGIYISDVLQKAMIEVEEEGTIAAAVTAIKTLDRTSAADPLPPPVPFIADHPFLFFIRDTATGRILFMGRVVVPKW